jgi:hypothetical protein
MDFRNTRVSSVKKKADNRANFAAGEIINRRTHHNSLYGEQEQTLGYQLCDGLQAIE